MCDLDQYDSYVPDDKFWNSLEKIISEIEEISLLGGEPFKTLTTNKIIELALKYNPSCRFQFTSNLNFDFQKIIKPILEKVEIGSINVSIDSFDPAQYRFIRKNGDFNLLMNSLQELLLYREDRLAQTGKSFSIFADMCVMNFNWKEIPLFIKKCFSLKIIPYFHYVTHPACYSIDSCPLDEQEKILVYLLDNLDDSQASYVRRVFYHLNKNIASLH